MRRGNMNIHKLSAKGKAKLSARSGTITLEADDAVSALQAIAKQANIKIDLTPDEVKRLGSAGKLAISLTYDDHIAGATAAAEKVCELAAEAQAAGGRQGKAGAWKMLGFVGLLLIVAAFAFVVAYKALERIYG